jgi:hypothetical protein
MSHTPHAFRPRPLLLALALGACLPALIQAQIPASSWRTFIDGSYSKDHAASETTGFEDDLYRAAMSHRSQAEAVEAFAARIGVSVDVAAAYAAVIVESVRRRDEGCATPCDFLPGHAFHDRVARLADEPTGQLLIAVGKNLDRISRSQDGGWIALAVRHPAASAVLRALFDYTGEPPILAAMLASTDPLDWSVASLVKATGLDEDGAPDEWDGWLEAFVEFAEHRAEASRARPEVRAALAQLLLSRELRLGLTADTVRRYLAYPEEIRRLLPVTTQRAADPCSASRIYVFTDELAAALWQRGHRAEARAMLQDERANVGPRSRRARTRYAALSDIFDPAVPTVDLFDRYFTRDRDVDRHSCDWPDSSGWFDAVDASPAIRPLAAARLREAGYTDLAYALATDPLYRRDDDAIGVLGRYARLFPDSVRTQRDRWSAMIDNVWHATSAPSETPRQSVHVHGRAEMPSWPEHPLPRGVAAWKDTSTPTRVPKGASLPVDPETVLRYEAVGREHAIVYQSSDYDMPGEVPAFGVWFARTEQGHWTRPIYLGLRQYFPYVVTPGSKLPLLAGDVLQLEVRVREIDPASITFPPIATGLKRSVDGLYLAIDLARARADRDEDGLSDVEEIALGLDPAHADTDGDGLPDGRDPLPLTAYRADVAAVDTAVARAVINRVLHHDTEAMVTGPTPDTAHTRAGAVFLIGDPTLFAGISSAPFRLIVYTDADLRVLDRGPAPFYAPTIMRMFSSLDGRRRYVEWSAKWAGGRFLVICPSGGECTADDLSSWVT